MKAENIIHELKRSRKLKKETITGIEENRDLRLDLLQYFETNKNRDIALDLLNTLSELRLDPNGGISGDTLMLACYILGKHGQIEDCLKIWETKRIDFDTYCYIDIQLVPFGGLQKTIEYLGTQTSEEAKSALEYVISCSDAGDFDDLERYFRETPWFI